MKITKTQLAVLHALLRLAKCDELGSVEMLAALVGSSEPKVAAALLKLEALGWADARRVRLTLDGLSMALATTHQLSRTRVTLPAKRASRAA
jgi:hypothetical protein